MADDQVNFVQNAVDDILLSIDRKEDFQVMIDKLEFLHRILVVIDFDDFVIEKIGRAKEHSQSQSGGYSANVEHKGSVGRPCYDISKEQLSFFLEQGFKLQDVATMLGTSLRTVKRRMDKYGLSVSGKLSFNYSH